MRPDESFTNRMTQILRQIGFYSFIAASLAVGIYFLWSLHRFVYDSDFFQIRTIQITADSDELKHEAQSWLDTHIKNTSDNLCAQNTWELTQRLGKLPRAKSVTVTKIYPGRLTVRFVERKAVAIARLDDYYQMDSEGVLLAKVPSRTIRPGGLPILTGIIDPHPKAGDHIKQEMLPDILSAMVYIRDNEWLLKKMIANWNLSSRGEVTAILNTGTEVRFGDRAPIDLLSRLVTALNDKPELENAKYIDLSKDSPTAMLVYRMR